MGFSHPVPLMAATKAEMPLVVELGRSKAGPPNLVVMQPGLSVDPPAGKASKDWMTRESLAVDEASGV